MFNDVIRLIESLPENFVKCGRSFKTIGTKNRLTQLGVRGIGSAFSFGPSFEVTEITVGLVSRKYEV